MTSVMHLVFNEGIKMATELKTHCLVWVLVSVAVTSLKPHRSKILCSKSTWIGLCCSIKDGRLYSRVNKFSSKFLQGVPGVLCSQEP